MLESLYILNYAIIDEMTVEFPGGLTVITGETGAGKSIVVDALELALGARASTEMIRADTDELEISCVFSVDREDRTGELSFIDDEGVLILRRALRSDGSGRCFINDRPVTLKKLKKTGDRLVDLHGQHDHQSLFDVNDHVVFLDGFGGLVELECEVESLFGEYTAVRAKIGEMKNHMENSRRDRELYRFQIKEIDSANISPGEDGKLKQSIDRLSHAAEVKALCIRAFQELSEKDGSVEEMLGGLAGDMENLTSSDPELSPLTERMAQQASDAGDLAGDLRRYAESIEDDPSMLAEMEDRLALIENMKKKYGPSLDDVFSYRKRIDKTFGSLEDIVQKIEELEIKLEEIKAKLYHRALRLSSLRKKKAPELAKKVESHLRELGMKDARLVVAIDCLDSGERLEVDGQTVTVGKGGIDRVEFMFSANPGVPPRPLARIASGGEVSRMMLSLKLALSGVDKVPTMVFDEIDSGVSGRVAESVGTKLLKLSENRQVVVITHLPQIAGKASCHYSARKTVESGATHTSLVALDDEMRREELASMLSGETLTDSAFAQAKELMGTKEGKGMRDKA